MLQKQTQQMKSLHSDSSFRSNPCHLTSSLSLHILKNKTLTSSHSSTLYGTFFCRSRGACRLTQEHPSCMLTRTCCTWGVCYTQAACCDLQTDYLACDFNRITLMPLVSRMTLSMSLASPASFQGLCCRMTPSQAQLYSVTEGQSPSPPNVEIGLGTCQHINKTGINTAEPLESALE